ncbi:MAG: hypothetical protein KDE48_05235 [Anaerolineales bacterium]|nr:hypothetical protein [Anaerolineales bacterium]
MNTKFATTVTKLTASVAQGPGEVQSESRQAAINFARALTMGHASTTDDIPKGFAPYLKKVALYAYKTTDRDVQNLKDRGYSEDEIFELTVSTALGASLARYEHGMNLLNGK